MNIEIRRKGASHLVILLPSEKTLISLPNSELARNWAETNYPEYVQGTEQYTKRIAQEQAASIAARNKLTGAAVWRARY